MTPDIAGLMAEKICSVEPLKDLAKKADTVWLASDEDREGEAIAWHLFEQLKLKDANTKRIVFHEITKKAILKAVENPRSLDYNLVNAQQARRVLDRLVGYELSPVLWRKIKGGLSAGRVQSVAVRLIVEREREITEFKPVATYKVIAEFANSEGKKFKANLPKNFDAKEEAESFLNSCIDANFEVDDLPLKIRFLEVMILSEQKSYTFAYSNLLENFENELPKFNDSLNSFEILSAEPSRLNFSETTLSA